jgi:DNA-binding GntR family transcriptional regulator
MTIVSRGQLARLSLSDAIRARLREQILAGELPMGQRLTEQGVAEAMGTSAGPVREAFASLTYEGLLMSLPNRGTFVSSVSEEEARGAYDVRQRVELYAFELARDRLTPQANAELDELIAGLKTAAAKSDYQTMIGLDMRFHGIFYTRSGNPILIALWPLLEGTIRKFVSVAGPQYTRDFTELALRHETLLANYRKGDMEAVAKELAQHGQDIWRNLRPADRADATAAASPPDIAGLKLP